MSKIIRRQFFVCVMLILAFITGMNESVYGDYTAPPTNLMAVSEAEGRIRLTWEAATTDGTPPAADLVYEVYRKRLDESAYYRVTDALDALLWVDNLDGNDVSSNGNDTKNDGVSPDATNLVWGMTYQYRVLARDEDEAPGTNTHPAIDAAATVAAHCDAKQPNLQGLNIPYTLNQVDTSFPALVSSEVQVIRADIQFVDWTDYTGLGSFKLLWQVNNGAVQGTGTTMNRISGGYPNSTILEGQLDISGANNGDSVKWWISGQDNHGNPMLSTLVNPQVITNEVMLITVDDTGPSINDSLYLDLTNDGVSKDDQWIIRFNEGIFTDTANLSVDDFELGPTANSTFGTDASILPGPLTNEVTIILGTNPSVKFVGNNLANRINYKGAPLRTIWDLAGNTAQNNQYTAQARPAGDDLPDSPRPKIISAIFNDVNNDGIFNSPDTVAVTFDKPIGNLTAASAATDYLLPVTGDALGAGSTQAIDQNGRKTVEITLGTGAKLKIIGVFNPGVVSADSPSGIDGATTTTVVDDFGNRIEQKSPDAGIDLTGAFTDQPTVESVTYTDTLLNDVRNGLSNGDILTVVFNKPIHEGLQPFRVGALNTPVTGDNLDNPLITVNPANLREVFVEFTDSPKVTVYGEYASGTHNTGSPSGVDVTTGTWAGCFSDIYGNTSITSTPKDITAVDTDGPRITPLAANPNAVLFTDNDDNGADQGDYLDIEFDEPIIISSPVAADFQLQNMDFGTGASFSVRETDVNNRIIRVTLGNNPQIVTTGPGRSAIDVVNNTTRIKNWANLNARSDGFRNVESSDALGPVIVEAKYTDTNSDGLNGGDIIVLTFDKPVILFTPLISDFVLFVNNDSFGTSALVDNTGVETTEVRIVLGNSPRLKIGGIFNSGNIATNAPSGIDIKSSGTVTIQDTLGNNARQNTPSGIDISSTDTSAPYLTDSTFTDISSDGFSSGDQLLLTFSEPITCEIPPAGNALRNLAFNLPVDQDNLGQDPVTVVNPQPAVNQILVEFITSPELKIAGDYDGTNTAGSSSGMDISVNMPAGMITDISGNDAKPNESTVGVNGIIDIDSTDSAGPTLTSAEFMDLDDNGPESGDYLELTFSEPVLLSPTGVTPTAAEFDISYGNLGTNPSFEIVSESNNNAKIRIILGDGASIQFNPPTPPTSTIDVVGTITSITDISGNGATASTPRTITSASNEPPYIVSAWFSDLDKNGVDQGDTLSVVFNKNIFTGAVVPGDFQLPSTNGGTRTDTFGENSVLFNKTGDRTIEIILGVNPVLYIPGVYSGPSGQPSGIDIVSTGTSNIVDAMNNNAAPRVTGPVDIQTVDTFAPNIIESYWSDENLNGAVDTGDTLSVKFNMPVIINSNLIPGSFNLPVSDDKMGFSDFTQASSDTVYLTLTNPLELMIRGTFNSGTLTAGSPSGIDIASTNFPSGSIVSESGIDAVPSTPVDIFSRDDTGPVVMAARYEDLNRNNTVDSGDIVNITFSENILLDNPLITEFNLHNCSFGTNPVLGTGGGGNILRITLDTGASITFLGNDTSSVDVINIINTVYDYSGNGAGQTTQKFITVDGVADGPKITKAVWNDTIPPAGVSQGDKVLVSFDKDLFTRNLSINDLELRVGAPPSTGPVDTFGNGAVIVQLDERTLEITLGNTPLLNIIGEFNPVNLSPGDPSGIDVSATGETSGHIGDTFGYLATANTPWGIDIESSDATGPVLVSAVFRDIDLNGVDSGDIITLTFDEEILATVASITASDFSVTNGSLGLNAQFAYDGGLPRVLEITLGDNPDIIVNGIFPTENTATGIDINGTISTITDFSGTGARTNGGVDITPFETDGPTVTGANYVDANSNSAVDSGDYVYVRFNETILINNLSFSDFNTPVSVDTIGGSPSFAAGRDSNEIRITLGTAPVINPTGIFSTTVLTSGSPSGIDIVNTNHLTDAYGNSAVASTAKDIDDGKGPELISAVYTDLDENTVDEGDRIRLSFNEGVTINNLFESDFVTPVDFNTIGENPVFAMGDNTNEVDIFLGTRAVLFIPGTYNPLRHGQTEASGINLSSVFVSGHITDLANNSASPLDAAIDITGSDTTNPTLVSARWQDKGTEGISSTDHIVLSFSRMVQATNTINSDFNLPVTSNTLGAPLGIEPVEFNSFTNEIHLILGSNPKLTVPGVYVQNQHNVNDPSGIDISASIIASHIYDVYGNPPIASTVKDIAGEEGTGPVVIGCTYWDTDNNGIDAGDILGVLFDKQIQFRNSQTPGINEFTLPVNGNSFGANPLITSGTTSADLRIELGDSPSLVISGVYDANTAIGDPDSPSGIRASGLPTGNIIDVSGNTPQILADTQAVDIVPADSVGPTLSTATIEDVNSNLIIDNGDRVVLTFDRAIVLQTGFSLNDINLPVTADSFGTGATFEISATDNRQLMIGLGAGPNFRVEGIFGPLVTVPNSPSGIGINTGVTTITDFGGQPVNSGSVIDINDEYKPYVLSAVYEDVDDNGLSSNDYLRIRFSEVIQSGFIAVTDFALTGTNDTLGTSAQFTQEGTDTVRITLGTNPSFSVAGIYPTDSYASGIDLISSNTVKHIVDLAGNYSISSTPKDITPVDNNPPLVTDSIYGDANGNGIIDEGDTVSVYFSKPVMTNNAVRDDFAVINGSLGINGVTDVVDGPGTNEVIITLGETPLLDVEDIYPTDAAASAIDIGPSYGAGHITTVSGTNPISSTPVDIRDLLGPMIISAVYTDSTGNGVDGGDILELGFNRNIVIQDNVNLAGFNLPVRGDSLGATPAFEVIGNTILKITLGNGAYLRISGVFNSGATDLNSPSGINISTLSESNVLDQAGNQARPAVNAVDITGNDSTAPTLVTAIFNDKDDNGVTMGDELKLRFSEPVYIDSAISLSDFLLNNGNLGTNPKFKMSNEDKNTIIIELGTNPNLSFFGVSQSSIGRSDATYIAGHITDISGNDWPSGVQTAVTSENTVNPKIVQATFTDTDNNGMGAGDIVLVRFNVPVVLGTAASTGDFNLPVAGDSFGTGGTIAAGDMNKELKIVLGTGSKITVSGTYNPSIIVLDSPSGIDINATTSNITSIGGDSAVANTVAVDIGSNDVTAPQFEDGSLTGNYGKNLIKAQGDTIILTAVLDDPSLVIGDIKADFTPFGGSVVGAATYVSNTATWNSYATGSIRGSVEIELTATDVAGNIGRYTIRAKVIQPASRVVTELTPFQVLRNSGTEEFILWVKPEIPDYATGVNIVHLDIPVSGALNASNYYTNVDVTGSEISVGNNVMRVINTGTPGPGEAKILYATGRITVEFGRILTESYMNGSPIKISFKADVPEFADEPAGKYFNVSVDNNTDSAEVKAWGGDADGDSTNSNMNIVTTIGIKIKSVQEEFVITPNYWKLIFTVKFNSNMDIERVPTVLYKSQNSLNNAQNVYQLSYVDSTWTGYAIIPYENASFTGSYQISVNGAGDYLGLSINNMEYSKEFSPTFLIAATEHPTDDKSLLIGVKYIKPSTDEVILGIPALYVRQTGTDESTLVQMYKTNRDDTFTGSYTIDKNLGGTAMIEVSGYAGDDAKEIRGKSTTEFSTNYVESETGGILSSPDKVLSIDIPAKSLAVSKQMTIMPDLSDIYSVKTSNLSPQFRNPAPAVEELVRVSSVYNVYPQNTKFVKESFVSFNCINDTQKASNTGLFMMENNSWKFIGRARKNNKISGEINRLGSFALFNDVKGPEIVLPEDKTKVYEKEYEFEIRDSGSGIDFSASRILLNGNLLSAEYVKEDNRVIVNLPSRLVQGTHELSGEILDNLGNVSYIGKAPLRAAGFMDVLNVMAYPNPATTYSRIRYTLGKNIQDLKIRIYDGSGRKVYIMNEFTPAQLSAGTHDTDPWMLVNSHFRKIANGIYFYKIIAKDADNKKIIKTGKIAVLR